MPSPSHSAKIGASTTRGNALIIFTYGSSTAARNGLRANQKPMSAPAADPSTNASTDSTSVIQRCRQIVPSANHLTTRENTSTGVEKKNGGSTFVAVSTCHSPIATIATRICSMSKLARARPRSPSPGLRVAFEHFGFQHVPDLAMQLAEPRLEFYFGDIARARQRDAP